MSAPVIIEMTATDNDAFLFTVVGVPLDTATSVDLKMRREDDGTEITIAATDVDFANGKGRIKFANSTDLHEGANICQIDYVIAGDQLTSKKFTIMGAEKISG